METDLATRQYRPTPLTRVLLQDMTRVICQRAYCDSLPGSCGHDALAVQMFAATLDHCVETLTRAGHDESAEVLRALLQ